MFFSRKKKGSRKKKDPESQQTTKSSAKRKFLPLEVKLMAMEAMDEGLTAKDISEVVGSAPVTIEKWYRLWRKSGSAGFVHSGSTPTIRAASATIKKRIEQFRRENPDAGVRTISNELKRNEAIAVSPETVRKVVNEAGRNVSTTLRQLGS